MDHKLTDHLPTIGFDVDAGKIRDLSDANDNRNIAFTDDPEEIGNADFIIIAVPTRHEIEGPGPLLHRIRSQNHRHAPEARRNRGT
jgi:UDP-N-acetyl-D-mannosaminuronate dehydrogenase